ncbi:MAG: hypothetical protein GTO51_02095 [Candidatus Latescibacteria bacterium]|nr:hypothetical protein [Candidatus Latescibacterota bacterium]NIM22404.1 hypothetical protein [Candidatus Latescibacterota bacterium]NIM64764.1 hypothetical protein [Candidatus Latescibacterota bacterium]NIO01275.1 hypothetical protein [Candidatus Latescibacterota bacterium]NIO27767.1 hypothetical protein [Candidatus Latescibacterota bacterium]
MSSKKKKLPWRERYKPRAPVRVQLLLAALFWSIFGAVLFSVGLLWAYGWQGAAIAVPVCIAAGLLKSVVVLDRTAARYVNRIVERGDNRCVGSFFSWKSWMLVVVMAGLGRIIRTSYLEAWTVGLLYAAVGTALLFSSRLIWKGMGDWAGRDSA